MYISLAGDGAQFTNKLFNTVEIKPKSYICLTNVSVKKNETITVSTPLPFTFYVDYNNIYRFNIPIGEYTLNSFINTFNSLVAGSLERFSISAQILVVGSQRRVAIQIDNEPIPQLDFGIRPEDSSGKPFDTDYNFSFGPANLGVDIAGVATFKDVGPNVDSQGYICEAGDQTNIGYSIGKQTLNINPFLTTGAPLYVPIDLAGTSVAGYDSKTPATNLINNSMAQASFQKPYIEDPTRTPLPETQINPTQTNNIYQTDLNRHSGVVSFVIGCGQSSRDFVLCEAGEPLINPGQQTQTYPADFQDITTGTNNDNIYMWMKWIDPRSSTVSKSILKIGFWALDNAGTKTWTYADARLTNHDEEMLCIEGAKYTIQMKPNDNTQIPGSMYHPIVSVDSLTQKRTGVDNFANTICFWDMDGAYYTPPDQGIFYNSSHETVAGSFKSTNFLHSGYEFLWGNVGTDYNGFENSGNYWGTEFLHNVLNDGYNKGRGFELRTGSGTIDWSQSNNIANTPGEFPTAFSVSRSFNSTATGYKNAYYKLPDMWGAKSQKLHEGQMTGIPEGTVLPATYGDRAVGSYFMSVCFRLDDTSEPLYQILFAYQGSDPATGNATEPHTMLGVTQGSDKFLCHDGGPNAADRDEVDIVKISDGTAYTIEAGKWIEVAIVFQKATGPNASYWIIVGVDEDGVKFKATPNVGKTPTKPIFGLGGNNICNGTQTVSTGLIGVLKFFKIGYYTGESLTANTNYDPENLIALCCVNLNGSKTNGNNTDWNYSKDIKTNQIVGDVFTNSFFGIGQPDSTKPLTIAMGAFETASEIVNSNPYDSLFFAPLFRQNYLMNTDDRYVVADASDPLINYLKGGTTPVADNDIGFIEVDDGGFMETAGFSGDKFLPLTSLLEKEVGVINGDATVDTELGLNDNRIHIDNLPIQSINGKVGAVDRAIYQTCAVLAVRQVGGEYVVDSESVPQKVWIPINNAGSMYLNEFNVKITDLDNVVDEEIINAQLNIEIKGEKEMIVSK